MNRFEKIYAVLYLLYMSVYIPCFFLFVGMYFEIIALFHLLGMVLGVGFLVIVIRDIYLRTFPNPNTKITWTLLILLLQPSVLVYFAKYGFKPRQTGTACPDCGIVGPELPVGKYRCKQCGSRFKVTPE